jgi:2-methylcitrate dehydratase PrpD
MRAHTTLDHTLDLAALSSDAIPASAGTLARCWLFDWIVVARAGADQPVSRIIRDFVTDEGGRPAATVVGAARKLPARAAALANGTISHALDYDDTHFAHIGHPSVAILPAALAVAEERGARAIKVCDAFLLGAEASCRIGMVLGRAHYERGFHQTATAGAFGATVAAGRLLGLTRDKMRHALSLVSTRASGLKSQFGTMGKPFNAGISAANGVEAASLAARGFISCDDGVGGVQGFIDTHAEGVSESDAWATTLPTTFIFEDIKYKLHACCHGTHAMLNALAEAKLMSALVPEQVVRVVVKVNPRWLRVCNIRQPRTGLEVKFSYVLLAAMVLRGIDTAADDAYTESLCTDLTLVQLAQRVVVEGHDTVSDTATEVMIELTTGESIAVGHDLATRLAIEPLERWPARQGARAAGRGHSGKGLDRHSRLGTAVCGRSRGTA